MWSRKTAQRRQLRRISTVASIEALEGRQLLSASPIGGEGNNVEHPEWGSAGVDLLRLAPSEYANGISTPGGVDRPSPREISNVLSDQAGQDIINDRNLAAMIYAWGQFIDHDFDLTTTGGTEPLSIAVPDGDPFFDPTGTGTVTIDTTRSNFDSETGTSTENPREQINTITAYLDGSMIYGSDNVTTESLRSHEGGRLLTSEGDLLPRDASGSFLAGDVRVNENVELTSLHTLFMREHNFWADQIAARNPALSDDELFDQARAIVVGELQAITYNEWLPALLGRNAIARYSGYDPTINPGISNEFSTAAFRVGHTLLGDDVEFLDNNGLEVADEIPLSQAFFNPSVVAENGIDSILKYLASDPASEVDPMVVDGVRNFLFGPPGAGGLDLVSLNIARGRDHGLADYNTVREAVGLPRVTDFSQITSNVELQNDLRELYGSVDNVDLWVGALAEDHVRGASVGATIQTILADQFTRLRDGDRFWYENQYSGRLLKRIDNTSLSDVIRRNTENSNLQGNVFFFRAEISGTVSARLGRAERPLANQTVELIDPESGDVIATTKTTSRGRYTFNVASGVRTGEYQVRATSAGRTLLSSTVAITRGDQALSRVNLSFGRGRTTTPRTTSSQLATTTTTNFATDPLQDRVALNSFFASLTPESLV